MLKSPCSAAELPARPTRLPGTARVSIVFDARRLTRWSVLTTDVTRVQSGSVAGFLLGKADERHDARHDIRNQSATVKRFDRISQLDEKGRLRAVLESPQGSRHKFKYDPVDGGFAVSSTFPAGMSMPFDSHSSRVPRPRMVIPSTCSC